MVHFCQSVKTDIRELLKDAQKIRIAVAYWGKEAVSKLDLHKLNGRDIEVICDLLSGGCNPDEIKELQSRIGPNKVLTCDGLHAKVWLTERAAIIGSSNASTNGLFVEGDKGAAGLIEANVYVDEPGTVSAIENWFSAVQKKARPISAGDLKRAKEIRKRIIKPPGQGSLLEALRSNPDTVSGRNIFVWIYEHKNSDDWVNRAIDQMRKKLHNSQIDGWELNTTDKFIRSPPRLVLDFDSSFDPPSLHGVWRVLDIPVIRRGRDAMLFCEPSQSIDGFSISKKDVRAFAAGAAQAVGRRKERGWDGPLEAFLKILSRT